MKRGLFLALIAGIYLLPLCLHLEGKKTTLSFPTLLTAELFLIVVRNILRFVFPSFVLMVIVNRTVVRIILIVNRSILIVNRII